MAIPKPKNKQKINAQKKYLRLKSAKIERKAVQILPIFDLIMKWGNVPERDMYNTYNMGVGMSIVVAKEDADKAIEILKANGEDAYLIGEIIKSDEKIIIVD